ncbi:MAG: hypothetical protein HY289_01455 [Planctomycetes bacterium]|nr:hypothetical protein [Planctomycetota bacterium]
MRPFVALVVIFTFAGVARSQGDSHKENVLFKELIDKGIAVTDKSALKLPAPTMADGLDKAEQMKVIKQLAGDDYPLDELMRASIFAPHIFKFRNLDADAADARGRGVDLWFIAHGNIDLLRSKNLQGQFGGGANKITELKAADLAKRKIKVKDDDKLEETHAHVVGSILDRVQVASTNHAMITRTKDSVLLASRLDTRFAKDADFPNQWRSITLQANGIQEFGAAKLYEGAGMYMKVTRLHEPAGAVFVEFHQVFLEPKAWFGDAPNMLKSKLPVVVQAEVRSFRKDFQKLKAK